MRSAPTARQHLREARAAMRGGDCPEAARHFLRALDRLPPGGEARDVAAWGLVDAYFRYADIEGAAHGCQHLQRHGGNDFYRAKARLFTMVLTALREKGTVTAAEALDPVEQYAAQRLGEERLGPWVAAAWSAFLWSVDEPPPGLDAVTPWGEALAVLGAVVAGAPVPSVPTLHFAHVWRALAPSGDTTWLRSCAQGRGEPAADAGTALRE